MNKKRIVGVALAVGACGVLAAAGMMLSKKSGAVVLDQAGNEIAKLILQDGKISYECEDKYQSYADIVSQEAVKMIQEREGVNEKTAAKILADREITVKTWLDRETLDAVIGSYNDGEGMACERFGAAVTDKEGHLTACYSDTKGNDNYNNVTKPAFAGSTMKPLSVYGRRLRTERYVGHRCTKIALMELWQETTGLPENGRKMSCRLQGKM